MANEYTTTALVKQELAIDPSDTTEDTLIIDKVIAASRMIDTHCGRRFFVDSGTSARIINPRGRVVCGDDGERLLVADISTTTGLVVEVGSASTSWTDISSSIEAEPTDALDLDPAEPITSLLYLYGYFTSYRRARVTAAWGWPAVPADIAEATLIQALRLYKRKDSPEGVLGSAEWGGVVRMSRWDPDALTLISPFVLPGVA